MYTCLLHRIQRAKNNQQLWVQFHTCMCQPGYALVGPVCENVTLVYPAENCIQVKFFKISISNYSDKFSYFPKIPTDRDVSFLWSLVHTRTGDKKPGHIALFILSPLFAASWQTFLSPLWTRLEEPTINIVFTSICSPAKMLQKTSMVA